MKQTSVILFSLVLVYGGVAWALAKCLSHDHEHEYRIEAHDHSHLHGSASSDDSRDFFVIHCPPEEFRIGPAAQSGLMQVSRLSRVTALHGPSFHKPELFAFRNTLWLDAVFRRTPASLYPNDPGRYLLLSILQI